MVSLYLVMKEYHFLVTSDYQGIVETICIEEDPVPSDRPHKLVVKGFRSGEVIELLIDPSGQLSTLDGKHAIMLKEWHPIRIPFNLNWIKPNTEFRKVSNGELITCVEVVHEVAFFKTQEGRIYPYFMDPESELLVPTVLYLTAPQQKDMPLYLTDTDPRCNWTKIIYCTENMIPDSQRHLIVTYPNPSLVLPCQ